MPGTGKTTRTWVATGIALLGVAALPAAAGATTATVDGEVIRIVDEQGIDDDIVITAGGVDTDGVAWEIDGVDGAGDLCQGTGSAFCTDGRFRDGDAPTRRFVIDLGGGDDELRYLVSSGHSGDEPEGDIRLGAGRDVLESRGLEAHTIDAGADDDVLELRGFAPSAGGGGVTTGDGPAPVVLDGGPGADTLLVGGRRGGDTVLGGPGLDTVSYADRTPAVHVTLDGVADDGTGAEGDNVEPDVEALIGTNAADELEGSSGDETIDGRAGADTLDGRGGEDTLSFASRSADIAADLTAGTTTDGDGLAGFEHLLGGSGDDDLRGNAAENRVTGGPGDDVLDGGPGGAADRLEGDAATRDTADYGTRARRVVLTLPDGGAEAVTLDGDRLVWIADVIGGSADDRLIGNARANRLHGGRGDDRIDGRAGDDRLGGGDGRDVIGALRAVPFGLCSFELGVGQVCTLDFFVATPVPDGRDTVRGGAGGDILSVRDGALDPPVNCGGGTDSLRRDALDPAPAACESVQAG